ARTAVNRGPSAAVVGTLQGPAQRIALRRIVGGSQRIAVDDIRRRRLVLNPARGVEGQILGVDVIVDQVGIAFTRRPVSVLRTDRAAQIGDIGAARGRA